MSVNATHELACSNTAACEALLFADVTELCAIPGQAHRGTVIIITITITITITVILIMIMTITTIIITT